MAYSSNDPRNYFALSKQADANTEATTGFKFIKFLDPTGINIAQDTQAIYEGGDGQDQGLVYRQHTKPDGQITCYARPDHFTFLSAWALGSAAAVGTANNIGTSIYVPNATIPFLTAEQAWGGGNNIDRAMSAILTGFTITANAGDPWKLTVPFIGGGTAYWRDGAASALAQTLETGDPAMYDQSAVLIDGATQMDVTQWTYTFTRGVDDNLFTFSPYRRKVVPLSRAVTLNYQLIWQDQAIYKNALYGGGTYIPAQLATTAFHAERQLSASQLIAIDIPFLRVTDVQVNRLMPDGQTVILNVSANAVKAGTGIVQHRIVHNNVSATSYL